MSRKFVVRVPEFRDMFICCICKNPYPDTKIKVCSHEFHQCCRHLIIPDSSCPVCKEPINRFSLIEYDCREKSKLYTFECNYCNFTGDITQINLRNAGTITVTYHERVVHAELLHEDRHKQI